MANQLIYGFGKPDFMTKAVGALAARMIYVEPLAIEVAGSSNKVQSKKQVDGIKVIAGSKITEELFTAKITIEATSWMAMQLAYGELAQTATNVLIPDVRKVTPVLIGAESVIFDNDLVTGGSPAFTPPVWVFDLQTEKPLTQIVSGTPSPTQFRLVSSGQAQIILSPLFAGKKVAYRIVQQIPSIEALGYGDVPVELDNFSFSALAKGDAGDFKLVIPSMTRTSAPSLQLGDVTKLEIEYDLLVDSGQRKSFYLFKL